MVKFKRIISILTAMIICMVLLVPSMPIAAASYLETDTSAAASGCTMLGIDGSYYVEAQNALDRINEIRKEACEAGNVPDPRDSSRYLTSSDYVEIKWSVSLEKIARIRAAEASMTMAHKRLNDEGIFNITYGDMTSSGECLAWYFGNGLIKGINLWYGEMGDWINQTEGAVTGHYTSLINPDNTYVGLGDFYSDETQYANTLAGEFSSKCGSLGETPLDANMNIVQKIEVKDSYISNYFLDGSAEIAEGTTETYIPKAKVVYNGYSTNMLVLDTVTYQSSDTSVATVSSDGTVTGVSKGTATITAYSDGNVLTTLEIEVGCRHEFTYERSGYTYTKTCSLCGATDEFTYYVYWGEDPSGTFGGSVNLRRKVGDNLYVWPSYNNDSSSSATKVVNVYSSDENVVSVSNYGYGNIKELTLSDSGIVELSIVPKDDAELTKTVIFRVGEDGALDISSAIVTLSEDLYTYTGSAHTPTPTVVYKGITLTAGTDYTVSYENNIDEGTAGVVITGTGLFSGIKKTTFVIEKMSIADAEINLENYTYVYDGAEKTPKVTVQYGNTILKENTDYTVVYSGNTDAGVATAAINGMGLYGGSKELKFTINKGFISDCIVSLSNDSFVFDGKEKKPNVTVMKAGNIVASSEYEISYKDNVDVGTATVTVMGIGNYEGEAFAAFEITPAELTDADIDITDNAYIYDGTAKEPEISVSMGGAALQENQDYTVSYSNNLNAGTARVIISGTGNYTGEVSESFPINEKPLSDDFEVIMDASDYTYDGTEKKPSVTVYDGEIELILSEDYTVSYRDNIEAGTGVIRINGKGNYSGYLERTFNIKKPIKTEEPAPVNNEVTLPKKNSTLRSAAVNGKFKVTKTGRIVNGKVIGAEITYVRPLNKKSKVTIPVSVTKDGVTYKVTAIAANAFKNNSKITKVTIGSNVRTIGTNAFYGCKKLKSVKLGKNVTTIGKGAFAKCTALTKISLPSKVKTIGVRAFYGCKRLKTITIKSTKLKTVGKYALKGINSRASIKLPKKYYKRYKKLFKSATGYKKTMRLKKV